MTTPPQIECRIPLFVPESLGGEQWGSSLGGLYPLADGSVVALLSTFSSNGWRWAFVHAGQGFRRTFPVPAAVGERVVECGKDPVTRSASYAIPFKVGERVGLLVTDRWAWVFDPAGDGAPVEIAIEPFALARCINASCSYLPIRAGLSCDDRVPVIFRHPDSSFDYPCYLSTLELDLESGTGRWSLRTPDGHPVTVPYRVDPEGTNGIEGYAGTSLGDAVWLGDRFRLFTMGNHTHYGRMGMRHAAAIETDADGTNPRCIREMDESSHGLFSADGRHMLLIPFFKSGARKGKPSLVDLDTKTECGLAVRGLASYGPLAYRDGVVWFAGNGIQGQWASLSIGADKPGEIVACRVA